MTTARGDQVAFMARQQVDFNTPAAGNFMLLPFYQLDMKPTADVSEDDAIVGDAFPGAAVPGLVNMTGKIEVPLGLQSIGWHLRGLLGAPVTTGSGTLTHVFKMAALPVPLLYTTCVSHRGIDVHFRQTPIAYTGMQVEAAKNGSRVRTSFDLLGSVEERVEDALDETPNSYTSDNVPVGFQGGVYEDGVLVAGVTGFSLAAGLGLTPDQETMNLLPTAASFLDGAWTLTGSLTARFQDASLYDRAEAGTFFDAELRFVVGGASIVFRCHNLLIERTGVAVPNGDILNQTFKFRASRPDAGDTPLTVTLVNATPGYGNPA